MLVLVALASLAAAVCLASVFTAFDPMRVKIIQSPRPPQAGRVVADVSKLAAFSPPLAIILRVTGTANGPASFNVAVDGVSVCATMVNGRTARRDCHWDGPWRTGDVHEIAIEGPAAGWTVDYLELATHHGQSNGFATFFVLPRASTSAMPVSRIWAIVIWLVVAGVSRLRPRVHAGINRGLIAISILAAVIGLLIVTAPLFVPYRIVIEPGTYFRWVLLLLLPNVWATGQYLFTPAGGRVVTRCLGVALLTAGLFGSVMHQRLLEYHGNYSGFLMVERGFYDRNPLVNARDDIRRSLVLRDTGYDGEFMYFAAFDPFLRAFGGEPRIYDRVVDTPPYRYGRIGFTWLIWLLSFGAWQHFPATMVWLVLTGLFATSAVLALFAHGAARSPAYGMLPLAIPGFWTSLQTSLPEPIAAATLLLGLYLLYRRHLAIAGVACAASLLVRETGAIVVLCVAAHLLRERRRTDAIRFTLIALAPVCLWRLYVGSVLYRTWGIQAYFYSPPTGLPLRGVVDLWRAIAGGTYYPGLPAFSVAGLLFPLVLLSGFTLALLLALYCGSAVRVASVVYGASALSLTFASVWVHVGNAQRTSYELFVLLAVGTLAIRDEPRWLRLVAGGWWVAVGAYAMFGAYDASFIFNTLISV